MKRYRVHLSGDGWSKTVTVIAENSTEMLRYVEEHYGVGQGKVGCRCNLGEAEEVGDVFS